jgi:hypothetical protein
MAVARRLVPSGARALRALGALTLGAFSCNAPSPPRDDHGAAGEARLELIPTEAPDIRGTITAASGTRLRVETVPHEPSGSHKADVTVDARTPVLRRAGGRGTAEALAVGTAVSVWFIGPVAESYPVQARARVVVLEDAGSR